MPHLTPWGRLLGAEETYIVIAISFFMVPESFGPDSAVSPILYGRNSTLLAWNALRLAWRTITCCVFRLSISNSFGILCVIKPRGMKPGRPKHTIDEPCNEVILDQMELRET